MANGKKRLMRTALVAALALLVMGFLSGLIPASLNITIWKNLTTAGVIALTVGIYVGELVADKLNVKV